MVRTVLLVIMLAVVSALSPLGAWLPVSAQEGTPAADCPVTTEEENTAIVQRYYDIVAAGDLDALDEVLAPVVYQHAVDVMDGQGIEEVQANLAVFTEAFADLHFDSDLWFTADEFVAARVIQSGTHVGDFVGIPATGVEAVWSVISIWRIECGRIAEEWAEADGLAFYKQLGLIEWPPTPAEASPAAG